MTNVGLRCTDNAQPDILSFSNQSEVGHIPLLSVISNKLDCFIWKNTQADIYLVGGFRLFHYRRRFRVVRHSSKPQISTWTV